MEQQDFFKLGVEAANSGDHDKAQTYFARVVQANPNSEIGWLYLGHCLADPKKRMDCYQRVLRINPSNHEARQALSALSQPERPQEINQNPYERQATPDRYPQQARHTPPVQTGYPHDSNQNVYERQSAPPRYTEQARQAPPSPAERSQKKRPVNKFMVVLGSILGLMVCVGAVCFAITKIPPATPAPPTATPTQPNPVLDATALPPPVLSTGAGKACLGYSGKGVTCLDANGWQTYNIDNSALPDNNVTAGTFCPDGRFAIAHAKGFSLVRDGQWEHLPQLAEVYGTANDLACDKDGRLWAAHHRGVSRFVDGAWQTFDINMLAPGEKLADENVFRIFAAPDGRIWSLTQRSVAMFANETWSVYQMGQGFPQGPLALTLDASGRAWVWYGDGVAVSGDGTWYLLESTMPINPSGISLDARGWLWMSSAIEGVSYFDGAKWLNQNRTNLSLSSDKVSGMVSDTHGRVWVGTGYGLSIFDGSQWQTYRMDNSDLIDNKITFVSVEHDGPALPALLDKPKGSISGKFPMTNAQIVICTEPAPETFTGETPCSGQPFILSTQSYIDGSFFMENVPPGYYYLYAETGDREWAGLLEDKGFDLQRILIEPGQLYELGPLEITE